MTPGRLPPSYLDVQTATASAGGRLHKRAPLMNTQELAARHSRWVLQPLLALLVFGLLFICLAYLAVQYSPDYGGNANSHAALEMVVADMPGLDAPRVLSDAAWDVQGIKHAAQTSASVGSFVDPDQISRLRKLLGDGTPSAPPSGSASTAHAAHSADDTSGINAPTSVVEPGRTRNVSMQRTHIGPHANMLTSIILWILAIACLVGFLVGLLEFYFRFKRNRSVLTRKDIETPNIERKSWLNSGEIRERSENMTTVRKVLSISTANILVPVCPDGQQAVDSPSAFAYARSESIEKAPAAIDGIELSDSPGPDEIEVKSPCRVRTWPNDAKDIDDSQLTTAPMRQRRGGCSQDLITPVKDLHATEYMPLSSLKQE